MLKDIDVSNAAGHPRAAMFAMLECCLPNFSCIVGRMDKERDWERLAERARTARGSRSQKAVAAEGGPSHTTLGKIERAEWRPTRGVDDTIDKLEKVYHWAPGSVDAILTGGDPAPEPDTTGSDRSDKPANDEGEYTVDDERGILEQSWSRVTRLSEAVLDTADASEELRAAARDVVYDVSAHLIIRILTGEFARRLEGWLARIYSEREGLYRQLSTGEPEFPWFTRDDIPAHDEPEPPRGDVSAADLVGQIRELFGELRRRVPQADAVVDESQVWSQSFIEGLRDELPPVGRREDRDQTDELGGR